MPFVDQEHRRNPDLDIPGDAVYVEYKKMMDLWRGTPRWGTVDKIAATIWPIPKRRYMILAFLVFFAVKVMPYEREKQKLNGDIE